MRTRLLGGVGAGTGNRPGYPIYRASRDVSYDYQNDHFLFFSEDGKSFVAIDRVLFADIALLHFDQDTVIRAMKEKGYRIQKRKLGIFRDSWVEV